ESVLLPALLLFRELAGVTAFRLFATDSEVQEGRAEALDLLLDDRPNVERGDDGSEPTCRRDGLEPGDAGADHEHLCRGDRPGRGHQEWEEPRQPVSRD